MSSEKVKVTIERDATKYLLELTRIENEIESLIREPVAQPQKYGSVQ